ncbi:hypothetical protein OROGR_017558 [Orobanche gracilis]
MSVNSDSKSKRSLKAVMVKAPVTVMKADLINKFDQVVVFKLLEKEHIEEILEIMLRQFGGRIAAKENIQVELSKKMKESLVEVGYDKRYGAWALKRVFAANIETKGIKSGDGKSSNKKKKTAQKTLGMGWGASSLHAFRNSPSTDFDPAE